MAVVVAAGSAVGVAAAAPAANIQQLRCFGAASRDPVHPCHDPRLDHRVEPSPRDALLVPPARCHIIEQDGASSFAGGISVCAFGAAAADAQATFALIGDSHAMTWRTPMEAVAQAKRWRGLSIARPGCPLTSAALAGARANRLGCRRWNGRVVSWLRAHPEVQVVFVIARSTTPVLAKRNQSQRGVKAAGYRAAWARLPESVRHIVVIRDNPRIHYTTFGCIHAAVVARRDPGRACALSRSFALPRDPAMTAAARTRSRRVQRIDLSRFMCGAKLCYPVVGGALVDKDSTHLATAFATTLGPYLLRSVDRLMQSWH